MKLIIVILLSLVGCLVISCEYLVADDHYDPVLELNPSATQIDLSLDSYNYANPTCDFSSSWYEVRKERIQSTNTLYYYEDLLSNYNNQWYIDVDWHRYTRFQFGSRWFYVCGDYQTDCNNMNTRHFYNSPDGMTIFGPPGIPC